MKPFPLYIARLMLAGLSGGAIGAAGGGAISFFASSSKSCDFDTVAIIINLAGARRLCYQSLVGREAGLLPGFVITILANLLSDSSYHGISDQRGRSARRLVERIKTSASRLPFSKCRYRASDL